MLSVIKIFLKAQTAMLVVLVGVKGQAAKGNTTASASSEASSSAQDAREPGRSWNDETKRKKWLKM